MNFFCVLTCLNFWCVFCIISFACFTSFTCFKCFFCCFCCFTMWWLWWWSMWRNISCFFIWFLFNYFLFSFRIVFNIRINVSLDFFGGFVGHFTKVTWFSTFSWCFIPIMFQNISFLTNRNNIVITFRIAFMLWLWFKLGRNFFFELFSFFPFINFDLGWIVWPLFWFALVYFVEFTNLITTVWFTIITTITTITVVIDIPRFIWFRFVRFLIIRWMLIWRMLFFS